MFFEWDTNKDLINQEKHGISFDEAKEAFLDSNRVITFDEKHSTIEEKRYFCFGKSESAVITVRFTYRKGKIRIIGAGYWREGKDVYDKENKI